jgi:hypothetical protein
MKRAAYRCYHCGQEHEDGKRNPCENRGKSEKGYETEIRIQKE